MTLYERKILRFYIYKRFDDTELQKDNATEKQLQKSF